MQHKEESSGKRDIHAELEAVYSPGNRPATAGRRNNNREPMPAPPMGSLSEGPVAPAPWEALGPPHGMLLFNLMPLITCANTSQHKWLG